MASRAAMAAPDAPAHGDPYPVVALSPLDTARFGVVVARAPQMTRAAIPAVDAFCRAHGVQMLVARCDAGDTRTAQALEAAGYRLMDTLVYWAHHMRQPGTAAASAPLDRVIVLGPGDAARVANLADAAFAGYQGHYHADPRLDPVTCTAIYADWARRCCEEPGAAAVVLGVEAEGELLGFLALTLEDGAADVPITAVAPSAQGRGVFQRLLRAALTYVHEQGAATLHYSCILTNFAAQKGLVRLGFELQRATHTFHTWYGVEGAEGAGEDDNAGSV